ncbi:DUF3052 domain-containing protein [Allomuricauda sp. SCSIO 65647]|uniref:DUF3052 domain-containing protein n=1 Tax=Allomuricauda sp. SCSIO 65647 TaxID=2908843 RepID=UPI001F28B4B6|nr:DUF3052 domain-containing protein [Muricauda sp. SCSIO 65647]UJH67322.1 DUF3052 domain-containing protein [Muricauda sp. SCSIO 65647]
MPAGYSKTPLFKKLGIKSGFTIHLKNQPEHYWKLFELVPSDIEVVKKPKPGSIDFVHLFCTSQSELKKRAGTCKELLKKTGMLWVSWPKGSSEIPSDIKRDHIRDHLLAIGLVDTKVAAIDGDWSGLKFMYRLKDR